jgi:hypothetical protein
MQVTPSSCKRLQEILESSMRLAFLAFTLTALPAAQADDWPAPVIREVFSQSRTYFVRVLPGKSFGDTVAFSRAAKGPYATAEFYRLEKDHSYRLAATAPLLNPVAPADFFVTDAGYLITLDNTGYGKVVAFYTPLGKAIRAYELSDLFTKSEIEGFGHSESSIQWRKFSGAYIRPGGDTLNITISDKGAGLIFELNGAYQYCETQAGNFRCRVANQGRVWQAFREPNPGRR